MTLTKEQHRNIIEHDYNQSVFSREKYLDDLIQTQEDAEKWYAVSIISETMQSKLDREKNAKIVEHLKKIVSTHDGSDYDARRIFDEIQEILGKEK